jgi:hypothetical protein
MFKFELSWLLKDGFYELVANIWRREKKGATCIEIWQNKLRYLRKYLRGWAKNENDTYKREKQELMEKIEQLDKKAEQTVLLPQEVDLKNCLKQRLIQLLRKEEMNWFQRSKSDNLLKGDSNTKYFQLVANGKYRKTRIFQLEEGHQIIMGEDELQTYITKYYKRLFGPSNCEHLILDENLRNDIPQISDEDNEKLIEPFTEKAEKRQFLK